MLCDAAIILFQQYSLPLLVCYLAGTRKSRIRNPTPVSYPFFLNPEDEFLPPNLEHCPRVCFLSISSSLPPCPSVISSTYPCHGTHTCVSLYCVLSCLAMSPSQIRGVQPVAGGPSRLLVFTASALPVAYRTSTLRLQLHLHLRRQCP